MASSGIASLGTASRKVGEAIDVYVNNRLVARGEVVVVDDRLGVTMTEIVKGERALMLRRTGRAPLLGRAAAAALATPPAQVEKGTLAGLLAGFALLSAAILLGGSAASFIDVPSLLIVAGGTLAVVTMCFSRSDVQTMLRVVASTIASASPDPTAAAVRAIELAERGRSRGVLYLEQLLEEQADSSFLHKAF